MKLSIISFLISGILCGQNLVLNPSFETYERCPWNIGTFASNIKYWDTPNLGTTDFFNICSKNIGFYNYNGHQTPKEGKSYAGFYLYSKDDYREYIQGQLIESLNKGESYRITFYISLAEKSTHTLDNISVLFTEEKLGFNYRKPGDPSVSNIKKKNNLTYRNIDEKYINPKKYTKAPYLRFDAPSEGFYDKRDKWMGISMDFVASGFENYFTIGNFLSNRKTQTKEILRTSRSKHQFSYYYIDFISVESLKVKNENTIEKNKEKEKKEEDKKELQLNTVYTFKNVLFDFNKSQLLNTSIDELNELYEYLKEHPNYTLEIYGHTDNVGSKTHNQQLSTQRAKAVVEYLTLKGLDTSKIKYGGYGSSQPISDNTTEEGRQQNRRVEFKVIN